MSHLSRRGVTLLELLVTIGIILAITAAVIPVMGPAMGGRRLREASRGVNTFLNSARNRAMVIGRPVGVSFERLEAEPQASVVLNMVEVPPPWSGDFATSTIAIGPNGTIVGFPQGDLGWLAARIRPGDILKLNHRNTAFRLYGSTDSTDDKLGHFDTDPSQENWGFGYDDARKANLTPDIGPKPGEPAINYPFQIIRQPVKSSAAGYQLPAGTVVDLSVSGDDSFFHGLFARAPLQGELAETRPVVLLFAPNGSVARAWQPVQGSAQVATFQPTTTVQFLIGRRDGVGVGPKTVETTPPDELPNWRDVSNFWVSVSSQNGMITSNPNGQVDVDLEVRSSDVVTDDSNVAFGDGRIDVDPPYGLYDGLTQARGFAQQGQSMGGN